MKKFLVLLSFLVMSGALLAQGNSQPEAVMDNNPAEQLKNEKRQDSIWRKEKAGKLGFSRTDGEELEGVELPKWARWDYDLERYFTEFMEYPAGLLARDEAGYVLVKFDIDTLGLYCNIDLLATNHQAFGQEVTRLLKELPHCQPCRDKDDKRISCSYTAYVPFLPQHYRERLVADSIAEEKVKNGFVEWEEWAKFQDGKPKTVTNYIHGQLNYDPKLLGEAEEAKGFYSMIIDSYGEVSEVKVMRSCGIEAWDKQAMEILKSMPRWTPTILHKDKGKYIGTNWTQPVTFKRNLP